MSWIVTASNEEGDLCHIGEFESREDAEKHFKWCLNNYYMVSRPQWEEDL